MMMRCLIKLLLFIFILIFYLETYGHHHRDTLRGNSIEFIENKGQWPDNVLYRANINGGSIYLEKDGFTYDLRDQKNFKKFTSYKTLPRDVRKNTPVPSGKIDHYAYNVKFNNSLPDPEVYGVNPKTGIFNYFLGNDPEKWATGVKRYDEVWYKNIYDNIDLRVTKDPVLFKYEFHCKPGSDPNQIKLVYNDVVDISLRFGNLLIKTPFGTFYELKPYVYQIIDGEKQEVSSRFKLNGNEVTYVLGNYDPELKLVIDPPVRIFASYTGSTADNWGYTATYDNLGYLYAGGNVFGNGYPVTTGAYQVNYAGGSSDIVISKFDTTGSFLVYSTYLGGSGTEVPHSLIVDAQGQLFILGSTGSADFPVSSTAFDQTFNGGSFFTLTNILHYTNGADIVISKLNNDGTQLLASTYVGGSGNDGLNIPTPLKYNYADEVRGEIILDNSGNVVVISSSNSTDFPVSPGSYQTTNAGGQDAVLFKMDNQLSSMIWGTYIGGSGNDAGYSIVVDDNDAVYVAGGTVSQDFPTTPAILQPTYQGGVSDGWIAKISNGGNNLLYSTYYGSDGYDQVYFVERDSDGNIYVLGQTDATGNTFIHNANWFTPSGGQFITKMENTLDSIIWSTAFGSGNGPDISPTAFMVDLCNRIYLSGWGGSVNGFGGTSNLPVTPDAFQLTTNNSDYYFMIMQDDASALLYATYYGGSWSSEHVDGGTSRFDSKGRIYQAVCAGCGGNSDFPTSPGAWSATNNSANCNVGVVVFDFHTPALVADFLDPPSICAPDTIFFINTSQIPNPSSTTISWDFGDGNTSTSFSPMNIYTQPGIYQVTLIISDNGSCNFSDTITKQVVVLSGSSSSLTDIEICKGDFVQIGLLPINDPNVTYQWIPTTFLNNPLISNPVSSAPNTIDYTLYVSNPICTDTFYQKLIVYDLNVDAGPDVSICQGDVQLTATTSDTNVSFHWSDNPGFTNMLNTSSSDPSCIVSINVPQYFYVRMYNAVCETIDSVFVDQIVTFPSIITEEPTCFGYCDGEATVTASGGTPPYSYQWSSSASTTNIATDLCSGIHSVTVTDSDGCFGVIEFALSDPPELELISWSHNAPCEEVCIGRGYLNVSGGTPPYQYLWDDPFSQNGNPAINLCPGFYNVTVTDFKGCTITDQIEVEDSSVYVDVSIHVDKDTLFEGQSVQLVATWLGTNYSYQWEPPTYLNNPFIYNPIATPYSSITYTVIVTDQWGCIFTDTITLRILEVICDDPYIYVPNAFTPNGDMVNDVLYVYTLYADEIYFAVFNRWGEKVFETNNKNIGWDGTYKGREVDPGVFTYYLEVRCYNQEIFKKKGNVTLIR